MAHCSLEAQFFCRLLLCLFASNDSVHNLIFVLVGSSCKSKSGPPVVKESFLNSSLVCCLTSFGINIFFFLKCSIPFNGHGCRTRNLDTCFADKTHPYTRVSPNMPVQKQHKEGRNHSVDSYLRRV